MRTRIVFSCLAILGLHHASKVHAEEFKAAFNMESDTLRPLPQTALAVVRAHAGTTGHAECARGGFVGEPVDLAGRGKARDWIAMTADGCAWGASSAALWVLKRQGDSYRVILHTAGHSVGLENRRSQGVVDLKTYHVTAGHYGETRYKYNGRNYLAFKSRSIDFGNPDDCRRNRDLDVCKLETGATEHVRNRADALGDASPEAARSPHQ